MRVLIIKMTSMGDLIHTLPALVEAKKNIHNLIIDWLVDDSFKDLLSLYQYSENHSQQLLISPIIDNIFTIPLRKMKKNFSIKNIPYNIRLIKTFINSLRKNKYDLTIDAQGLIKSALITKFVKTDLISGFDYRSCKEPLASIFYNHKVFVDKNMHAINRIRHLFARSMKYDLLDNNFDYQSVLHKKDFYRVEGIENLNNYILFLHGTTWETKRWKLEYWQQLACLIMDRYKNTSIVIMSSNSTEYEFVKNIQNLMNNSINGNNKHYQNKLIVLSDLSLIEAASVVLHATAVVAVDTGFAHLAGASGIPVVGIYGPSDINKAGVFGVICYNIQAYYHCSPCLSRICLEYKKNSSSVKQPCMKQITPQIVFDKLDLILSSNPQLFISKDA